MVPQSQRVSTNLIISITQKIWGLKYGLQAFWCSSKLIHFGWRGSIENKFIIILNWGMCSLHLTNEFFQAFLELIYLEV